MARAQAWIERGTGPGTPFPARGSCEKRCFLSLPRERRSVTMATARSQQHDKPSPWRFIHWGRANEQQPPVEKGDQKRGNFTYKVVPGETLADIAAKFDTKIEVIMEANNILNPNNLAAGQLLWIPRTHEIVKGDTLYSLSRKYGVKVAAIQAANGIDNPDLIYAGDIILIPDGQDDSKE